MPARVIVLLLLSAVGVHISLVDVHAQALDSGSNGSDGALTLTTPGEVVFDPAALKLDTDRDNVFHFTTITIGTGVTLRMPSKTLQGLPVIWLASGAVQIAGTIDLNGQNGAGAIPGLLHRAAEPGAGGYPGGVGFGGPGFTGTDLRLGLGPGGGPLSQFGHLGSNAGHTVPGGDPFGMGSGAAYGNAVLVPLRGGSGGGGSGSTISIGTGGGAGGGAIRIFSNVSIVVNGMITANGGNGGNGANETFGTIGGGGGSGGSIHLIAPTITGSGVLSAKGGTHGHPAVPLHGSPGRLRVDGFTQQFGGTSDPTASIGTPYNVPLPAGVPSVRVTSVAGIPVSASPSGEAATPDASINQSGPVTVAIEARNIPLGTVLEVRVMSEALPDFVVNSTPLTGTQQLSSATAEVSFPPGFSRGFVRATWSPPSP